MTLVTPHITSSDPPVLQEGAGPDILLIPGLTEDAAAWEAQSRALSDGFRVTRYAGRGSPGHSGPIGPYRLTGLVSDAVGALDAAGVARAHVVGSSVGGVVAQQLALAHPERVSSLVLVSTWAASDRALRALLSTWRWAAERARSAADLLQVAYSSTYSAAAWNSGAVDDRISAAEAAFLAAGEPAWRAAREAFIWTTWAAQQHDGRPFLPSLAVPALVVAGEADRVLAPEHGRELAALLPGAALAVVADAGHRPFDDQPERFDELLRQFLNSSVLRPAEAA